MSELSLVRRSSGSEGMQFTPGEYTCWQYGINHSTWWWTETPYLANNTYAFEQTTVTRTFYSTVTINSDGTITLSGQFSSSGMMAGYTIYISTLVYCDGSYIIADGLAFRQYTKVYVNAKAPGLCYSGLAFSKESTKYPNEGNAPDGYYYKKKTGTEFNPSYW